MSLTESFDSETETPLTDRKQIKARTKGVTIERDRRRATLLGILNVREGRDLFWWLLEQFGPTRSPLAFAGPSVDIHHTMTNIGMANAGNILLGEITAAAPDQYMVMLAEEQERKEMRNSNA